MESQGCCERSVGWEELKSGIQEAFTTDRVDVEKVKRLMSSYTSRRSDWEQYEHFDRHKSVSVAS